MPVSQPTTMTRPIVKAFNYLHVSGFAAMGLIVACVAQQWLGSPQLPATTSTYQAASVQTVHAQEAYEASSRRIDAIRDRGQQELIEREHARKQQALRDRAWAAFYQAPEACKNPESSIVFNACADEHIRARRLFDQSYTPGKSHLAPFQSALASNE